jgi:hypothetical protein
MRKPSVTTCLAAVLLLLYSAIAGAEETTTAKTSPLDEAIMWLPSDTETLTVAHSFKLEASDEEGGFGGLMLGNLLEATFFVEFGDEMKLDPLRGRTVSLALLGQRNFDSVSSFGGLRCESCAIVLFEEDLGGTWEKLKASLSESAEHVRRIEGQEVFQYAPTTVMEPWVKLKPWQGLFVARPTPKALLIASSDKYLEEVLRRMSATTRERALRPSLPEWKHVDRSAAMWTIRHIPTESPRTFFDGVTISWQRGKVSVTYVGAKPGAEKAIRTAWDPLKAIERVNEQGGTGLRYDLAAVKPLPRIALDDSAIIMTQPRTLDDRESEGRRVGGRAVRPISSRALALSYYRRRRDALGQRIRQRPKRGHSGFFE